MDDEPSPLIPDQTFNRLEPGIAFIGAELSLASIAISLKRIADHMPNKDDVVCGLDSIVHSIDRK